MVVFDSSPGKDRVCLGLPLRLMIKVTILWRVRRMYKGTLQLQLHTKVE